MSGKHTPTPGPWCVEDPMGDEQGDALWIVSEGATPEVYDWRCVAIVTSDDPEDRDGSASAPILSPERDANARLIASAPSLLEALENIMLAAMSSDATKQQIADMAHAAIQIARGGLFDRRGR